MFRKTLRWLMVLLGLAGAAGGAGMYFAWVRGDEMLRVELQKRLGEIAPMCDVRIGTTRFDWDRSVRVRDFLVRPKTAPGGPPAVAIPEAVVRINRERFLADRKVEIQSIRLIRPRLELTRRTDGSWSVADLLPIRLPDPTMPCPEWQIEDATIRFRLEQEGTAEPIVLTLQDADLRLVPSGRRQVLVRGLTDVADSGPLKVEGRIDLDRKTWNLSGSMTRLSTSGTIAGFALKTSPELRDKLAALGHKLRATEHALLNGGERTMVAAAGPLLPPERPNPGSRVPTRFASTGGGASVNPIPGTQGVRIDVAPLEAEEGVPNAGPAASAPSPAPADLTGLGLNAVVDVRFNVGQSKAHGPPEYQVWVDCRDGQIVNPLLPFALRHLRGGLYWDAAQIKVEDLRADGGGTAVRADAAFRLPGAPAPLGERPAEGESDGADPAAAGVPEVASGTLSLAITDLPVSDHYPGKLPPGIEKFLEAVRPAGPIDVAGTFDRDPAGRWAVRAFTLTAKGATAVPEAFPYPVRDIAGTLTQTAPGRLEARMTGKAGLRPATLVAVIENPGLEAEIGVEISVQGLALDEALRGALKPEARAAVETLGLNGFADCTVNLYRPPGLGQKYRSRIDATIRHGEAVYQHFPFRLTEISGRVVFDSVTETWTFLNMAAVHDRAKLTGRGTFRKPDDGATPPPEAPAAVPPGLAFEFGAENVGLGNDVRAALPPDLKATWDQLRPGGTAHLAGQLAWIPGGPPDVRFSKFDLVNGSLLVRAFPYPLDSVQAKLTYAPGLVKIVEFVARHDETWIQSTGGELRQAEGEWLLNLPDLYADGLLLGRDFRRSAPAGLRAALESLNPGGPLGVQGSLQLRGSGDPQTPITAGWDLTVSLADNRLSAGLDLEHVYGQVNLRGDHDGTLTNLAGDLALDRADVWGNRFENLRGPFRYDGGRPGGDRAMLGASEVLEGGPNAPVAPNVPRERQMTADFLGGVLTANAAVTLADPNKGVPLRYAGRVTLAGGRLERYAPILSDAKNLAGVMNGWVNFSGEGPDAGGLTGRGRLLIEPAALYELPVIVQLFSAVTMLSPGSPDRTAFNNARFDFRIRERTFLFDYIDLAGDSIRFVGRGWCGFDERLRLDFYSTLPRNPGRAVPVIGPLVGAILDVTATGWIGIEVTGKVSAPHAKAVPAKALDDGVREFLNNLAPPRPAPRR